MPGGAPIFQDGSYQSQIENTAGTDRGTMESSVNEPNRSVSFMMTHDQPEDSRKGSE